MKCLFGTYQKNEGTIYLDGKEVNFSGPKDALENGIAMVHQELNQCLERNVIDNLFLGRYPTNSVGVVDEGGMKKKASELFRKLGMTVNLTQPCGTCPFLSGRCVRSPSDLLQLPGHCSGRAHLLPDGGGGGAPVPHHQYAQGQGLRHYLHQSQNGGDPPHQRRHHRHARRPVGGHPPGQGADHGGDHQAHGGPGADQPLPAQDQQAR